MSTRSFLSIAMDLFDPVQLKAMLAKILVQDKTCSVPRTTVHARSVVFSHSAFTLLTEGNLAAWMSRLDAIRMVTVSAPIFTDYFSFTSQ